MNKRTIKTITLLLSISMVLMFAGCEELTPTTGRGSEIPEPDPAVLEAFDQNLANASNEFGFQLFQALMEEEENKMISPTSIYTALAMTMNGAGGETREAMEEVLGVSGVDLERFNQNNLARLYLLQEADEDVILNIANSMWMREDIELNPAFVERNQQYYDAVARALDFSTEESVETINQWVNDSTEGLIEEIVDYPIDPMTILFLINAVYFQGDWTEAFDPENTEEELFHGPEGAIENVPFMHRNDEFSYLNKEGEFQAIRLPYGEEEQMAMYVFLPAEESSLREFVEALTAKNWNEWQKQFSREEGQLWLPRFTMEYEKSLKEVLAHLGMEIAFDPNQADFFDMVTWDEGDRVYISDVKHKSFIEVDETGTEAAAVTSVEMRVESAPMTPPFEMKVNRPFYFLIHDEATNEVLFNGTVVNPME